MSPYLFPLASPSLPLSLSHPSRWSQSTELISLCYVAASHKLSTLHLVVYICPCHSLTLSQLTLPPPHILKSILYVFIFIPVLPLGSSEGSLILGLVLFSMICSVQTQPQQEPDLASERGSWRKIVPMSPFARIPPRACVFLFDFTWPTGSHHFRNRFLFFVFVCFLI